MAFSPTLSDYGLGRLQAVDARDRNFMLASDPKLATVIARRNKLWAYFDQPLDQGPTGTCVGHGWKYWLSTAPIIQSDVNEPPHPFDIYDECTKLDPWPENDNDVQREFGTSVRAGAKVLQRHGYLESYQWAWDIDTCINWLAGIDGSGRFVGGPVVIGVNWYYDMFAPDLQGFMHISPESRIAGGHCVCLTGWNERSGFAYAINSWGGAWGKKGRMYFPGEILERLIDEDGEICTAAEVKITI